MKDITPVPSQLNSDKSSDKMKSENVYDINKEKETEQKSEYKDMLGSIDNKLNNMVNGIYLLIKENKEGNRIKSQNNLDNAILLSNS